MTIRTDQGPGTRQLEQSILDKRTEPRLATAEPESSKKKALDSIAVQGLLFVVV